MLKTEAVAHDKFKISFKGHLLKTNLGSKIFSSLFLPLQRKNCQFFNRNKFDSDMCLVCLEILCVVDVRSKYEIKYS